VLCVGRLSPEKNPLGLLNAWSAISPQARSGAWLAMVGDGPDGEAVRGKTESLNLKDSVYFAGNQSEVVRWYRAADVYVTPSHFEGLSNTMLEALACGLPVVSTKVSGSEAVTEPPSCGLVVDVANVQQLADAITSLLQDGVLRTHLAENARRRFESTFSLARVAKETSALYQELLDRNAGSG